MSKSALITGANRGIGMETAKQLSKEGIFIYLGSRDFEKGKILEKELHDNGFLNVKAIEIDVTKPETILLAKKSIEKERGHLDILINNAGISGILPQSALTTDIEDIKKVFEVNFYGVISVTQTFIDLLRKAPQPRIVNVSTSVGSLSIQSNPEIDYPKFIAYASSKSAMNMYTIHLAHELRNTAFKVNAVCPGYTKTDFTNFNGGTVEDAGKRIAKYALIDQKGPTGKFFSEQGNPGTGEIPW